MQSEQAFRNEGDSEDLISASLMISKSGGLVTL